MLIYPGAFKLNSRDSFVHLGKLVLTCPDLDELLVPICSSLGRSLEFIWPDRSDPVTFI